MINLRTLEKISINDGELIPIIDKDPKVNDKSFRVILAPDNVIDLFEITTVDKIDIYAPDGVTLLESLTKFGSIQDISVNRSGVYRDEGLNPILTATVVFAKKDIEEAVRKLEEKVFPVIEFDLMTLEQYAAYKTAKLGEKCQEIIYAGIDMDIDGQMLHFSLTEDDQRNISSLASIAMSTRCSLPYHADKHQCQIFSYQDIIMLYARMQAHILYQTTYCNALNTYVRSLLTKKDMGDVEYGDEIPDASIMAGMNAALEQGQDVVEAILSQYGLTLSNDDDNSDGDEA